MKYRIAFALAGAASIATGACHTLAAADVEPATAALHGALTTGVLHAREWLDQGDYKSLAQSAGGLELLAALLKAKSDDRAWQAATGNIAGAVDEVRAAAGAQDAERSRRALAALDKAIENAKSAAPTGKPADLPRPPAIRPLMLTIDGISADAKVAILSGDVPAAKNQAYVLAELARLVSNSRTTGNWSSLASDFAAAAQRAATSPETDPQAVRKLLRGISEKCEACHDRNKR
jgi:hypothetical protein